MRRFIFLSSGRAGGRSKLVFLPVFLVVQSSLFGNEKWTLNSDDFPCNRVSSGNELEAVISPWGGGIGKRRGLPGAEGERKDAGEPSSGGDLN